MLCRLARVCLLAQFLGSALADQAILGRIVNPLDDNFARLADETLKEFQVPGVAIGVIDGDDIFTQVSFVSLPWFGETR